MKIYYDILAQNVSFEAFGRYFGNGSLEAVAEGNNVFARYRGTTLKEFYEHFSLIQKQDGSPAGTNATEVVAYLNNEFNQVISLGIAETTATIQTKRPLKTVNNTSLEGVGNITIPSPKPSLNLVKSDANTITETVIARWEIPANSITALSSLIARVRFQSGGTATSIWRLRIGATGTISDTLLAQLNTSAAQVVNSQGGSEFTVEFPTATTAIGSGFAVMQNAVLGTTTGVGATATIIPIATVFLSVTMQLSVINASLTKACSAVWGN
jgi:hypothetical protein